MPDWTVTPEEIALVSVDDELSEYWTRELFPDPSERWLRFGRAMNDHFETEIAPKVRGVLDAASLAIQEFARSLSPIIRDAYNTIDQAQRQAGRHKPGRGRRAPANRRKRQAAKVF